MQKNYDLLSPQDKQIYASKMTRFSEEYSDIILNSFKKAEERFTLEQGSKLSYEYGEESYGNEEYYRSQPS